MTEEPAPEELPEPELTPDGLVPGEVSDIEEIIPASEEADGEVTEDGSTP
ncbi:MAG: hypothetical protein K6G83_01640 [Lachnospiraceae bacterium]|nr:hypothetical protein [Lachnospiraceae bacterium]